MNTYGSSSNNYFNDITALKEKINSEANYVLLVNVLHEISPTYWFEVFQNIQHLLKDYKANKTFNVLKSFNLFKYFDTFLIVVIS